MENTFERITALAKEAVQKKIAEKTECIERAANKDLELLNKAIELVKNGIVYKKFERYGSYEYILATEKMLCDDYINPPKYDWKKGIEFYEESSGNYRFKGIFTINGESYYDMRYLLTSYAEDTREALKKAENTVRTLREHLEKHEEALQRLPKLKKMILEWQEREAEQGE